MSITRRLMIGAGIGAVVMPLLTLVTLMLLDTVIENLPEASLLFYLLIIVVGAVIGLVVGFLEPSSLLLQAALGGGMGAITGGFLIGPPQILIGMIIGLIVGTAVKQRPSR